MESIWKATQGKTVINVTHRLHTLKDYDQILVLKGGIAVEKGTFE
jgi:ABC-type multidrug transport system fused ATPase/permease subunit